MKFKYSLYTSTRRKKLKYIVVVQEGFELIAKLVKLHNAVMMGAQAPLLQVYYLITCSEPVGIKRFMSTRPKMMND